MRQLSAIIFSIVLALSVGACGSTASENAHTHKGKAYSLGEEIPSDYFPFTVEDAGYAGRLSMYEQKFLKPGKSESYLNAKDGLRWLYYDIEYSFCGKKG